MRQRINNNKVVIPSNNTIHLETMLSKLSEKQKQLGLVYSDLIDFENQLKRNINNRQVKFEIIRFQQKKKMEYDKLKIEYETLLQDISGRFNIPIGILRTNN